MSASNQKPLGSHERFLPKAEIAGRQLIRSWIIYGPKQLNHFEPDAFPTGPLQDVAGAVLQSMLHEGVKDEAGLVAYFTNAPDGTRAELIECTQEFAPMPSNCGPLLHKLHEYDRALRFEKLSNRLQQALASDDPTAEIIRELGEIESGGDGRKQSKPFEFFHADHLEGTSEALDFVEGLLTEGGASVIYGPSNCGKSFWIVDLGVSVASGTDFRDELEVEQGAVVYIALEGSHGAENRIAALKQAGRLKPGTPFFLIFESVSLLEAGHADRLAETIAKISEESGMKVRLVILDTMARAMAGGDENSGVDMTSAVKSIDAIRAATGAHVAIVHHCGKDEARGARGHSSLRAAVDTEIEVSRAIGETISTVRVTKQRDLQAGEAMPFSLEVVTIGTDRRGKPITSCIVRHEDEMMASKPGKAGRPPAASNEELLALLPAPSTASWQRAANDELGVSKSAFHRALKHLHGHGAMKGTGGNWVAA